MRAQTDQGEYDLEQLREVLNKNLENKIDVDTQEEPCVEAKMNLEHSLEEPQSQCGILKDKLPHMSNVKIKLKGEIHCMKDEHFHEQEDLDFKINELQLTKEDYYCVFEKLKLELQAARQHYETAAKEHKLEEKVENLSSNQLEIEELKCKMDSLQEDNNTVINSINQKEFTVGELEEIIALTNQNRDILNDVKCLGEERETLQKTCVQEQVKIQELQREVDVANQYSNDLKEKARALIRQNGTPQLQEPRRLSALLRDFLECSLELDEEQRWSAQELLQAYNIMLIYYAAISVGYMVPT
ncbi:hypothetical protein DUI87_12206 [Hirundo rustica rustica]|uniref:Uncharacterized protein n=1 Tax=Hirundo rustica rustica TaxID=333673 RepID=A0A3M0KIC6_HIRRU|nr:hypothetical protein DUI87_12206 [Hirundo rustica rustica]